MSSAQQVPLGQAAAYGLLSGQQVLAKTAPAGPDAPIQVLGKAGAGQTIDTGVAATAGVYAQGGGGVPQALSDLALARAYCTGQGGTALNSDLAGQTLTGGTYQVNGNAVLSSGGVLTISGDTATVVIINITGQLTLAAQTSMQLLGVVPHHVFWNIGGNLSAGAGAGLWGVALLPAGTTATLSGYQTGRGALLSGGSIALYGLSATVGHNKFFAPLGTSATCNPAYPGQACVFTRPGSELIDDGSFELEKCCPLSGSDLDGPSNACFWQSATSGSADYFHRCAGTMPNNILVYAGPGVNYSVDALAQNSRATTGNAYAGIYAYLNGTPNYREYVYQKINGTVQAGQRYYAEFSAHLASSSQYSVAALGMLVRPMSSAYPNMLSGIIQESPAVSGSPVDPNTPPQNPSTLDWRRVGGVFTAGSTLVNPQIIIGNFGSDAQATLPGPGGGGYAYFFIDNATLSPLTEAGPNIALGTGCTSGPTGTTVTLGTTPMPALVGATYFWTDSNSSWTSTSPNPTVSPTQTTTYALTVTINGQAYSSQATVTINSLAYTHNGRVATYQAPAGLADYELGGSNAPQTSVTGFRDCTVIDASQPPYNGRPVVFDGVYHIKGNLQLVNGTFHLNPGTTFYVDGYGHRLTDSKRIAIQLQSATLELDQATLRATCDEMWEGIQIGYKGTLSADQAVIRDAQWAVQRRIDTDDNSPNYAHFYLANSAFLNNTISIVDGRRAGTTAQADYITNCQFATDLNPSPLAVELYDAAGTQSYLYRSTGVAFTDVWEHYGNNTGATPLTISGCTFDRLQVGVFGTSNNLSVLNNTFTSCWYAAAYSQFSTWPSGGSAPPFPAAMPVVTFADNLVLLPPILPVGYTVAANSPVYGVVANEGFLIRNNQLQMARRGALGTPARPVGVSVSNNATVGGTTDAEGNRLLNLDTGIEAKSGDAVLGTAYTFGKNTFAGNQNGVVFQPHPYTSSSSVGPVFSVQLRCNSFASSLSGALGVWVQQGTNMPTLGSANLPNGPNGNNFSGLPAVANYVYNDPLNSRLDYFSYPTNNEYSTTRVVSNVSVTATGSALGACGGTTGVNSRMSATRPSAQSTTIDEGPSTVLPIGEKSSISSASRRLSEETERHYYLAYQQVIASQREASQRLRLPGLPELSTADRHTLQQVAASGSLAASSACQLLRYYEPNCQCSEGVNQVAHPVAKPVVTPSLATSQSLGLGEPHPNPASETVTFSCQLPAREVGARLEIWDMTGRVVQGQNLDATASEAVVSVRELPAGVYTVRLVTAASQVTVRKLAVIR